MLSAKWAAIMLVPSGTSFCVAAFVVTFSVVMVFAAAFPAGLYLVRRPGPIEKLLKLVQCICPHAPSLSTGYSEAHGPVQHRQLGLGERPRDLFRNPKPRDAAT
jgi:hypothetical protein